jgi:exonuclease III
MKLLSWNIRGLNMPLTQKEIRKMILSHRISILCVVETRVKLHNFPKVASSMLPG